ncbi:MAG TPA: hypothetical protein VF257_02015 [Solirubrobacteraceae bacterium]
MASAATVTVTGDDGNAVALAGPLNIRNMSPRVAVTLASGEHYGFTVTGPNGAQVSSPDTCVAAGDPPRTVDYVGNGAYTVNLTRYAGVSCTGGASTTALPFTITASVALGQPQSAVLTRKPGEVVPNTVSLPIDLNPGALAHEVFVARNVQVNPDGSLPGAPVALFPDAASRTVPVRLDQGPGRYVVVARAKGFAGLSTPSAFTAWSAPASIQAFAPFDLQKFTWTDQRGPSYRFAAVIRATGASGRVNVAIGRGTKGRYRSYGTAKIRRHRFSKRFRLTGAGTYRIRFKYKGNATVAGGFEVHEFRVTRRTFFRPAAIAG